MANLSDWAKKISDKAREREIKEARSLEQKKKEEENHKERYEYLLSQITPQVERIAGYFAKILGGELLKECSDNANILKIQLKHGVVSIIIGGSFGETGRYNYYLVIITRDISDRFKKKLKWLCEDDISGFEKYYGESSRGDPSDTYASYLLRFSAFKEEKFEKVLKVFCESAFGV
ncbi:MAG: hypothetical protein COS25_00315 [Candidatus Nealsonbacteria bacterium CG02_land_8_20_14_3_00_37_10]|uniref:Uncharacterized protein n=1 Tax=Candidatus Nealsonbacteria bacterium CG02_land_8_20_14_3_00_37_10 TaxID=1974699 RepID=A0A2M7DA65_9BACT|nr:MAG: hypothetical protein COS25_00315 [Candidatus Nealsonbacteria bacterium CG02_land_8_20_14_3_00_37_10]